MKTKIEIPQPLRINLLKEAHEKFLNWITNKIFLLLPLKQPTKQAILIIGLPTNTKSPFD